MRNGNGTMPRPAFSGSGYAPAVTCSTDHLLIRSSFVSCSSVHLFNFLGEAAAGHGVQFNYGAGTERRHEAVPRQNKRPEIRREGCGYSARCACKSRDPGYHTSEGVTLCAPFFGSSASC